MTTINCSSHCAHQLDGKCMLDNVTIHSVSLHPDCIFFEEKSTQPEVQKVP